MENQDSSVRVPYALTVFGDEERAAVADVLKTPMIVPGARVKKFEESIARLFGKEFGVMVNSGSSANLLAFELLNLPKGSEVITPVLTFSTTLAPIVQKGLVPVFADVVLDEYTIDINQIEKLITEKTKALMIPSLIGNIPDYKELKRIKEKYNLYLIEDSCDTLGAKLFDQPTGVYSDISTTSFYASHIITAAGSGGMICMDKPEWFKRAKTLAGWGRSSAVDESETSEGRFNQMLGDISYDGKFIFNETGYNFQSTEISGAFGLEQLKKFEGWFQMRKQNFKKVFDFLKKYEQYFILPRSNPDANAVWLAFPITIREDAPFKRADLVSFLEGRNIQTRPIFTGNVLRQPGFSNIEHGGIGEYPNTELIMRNALLIGCHQGLTEEMFEHLFESFDTFIQNNT
ncbi:MAG: aminotransferase class I/II-fold pyridoxal phosphate-dependent enzyme [Patescibacteria group bacterium]